MLKGCSRISQPHELRIARYLGSEELTSDPRNHCVPVYEVLPVPTELQFVGENEDGEDIIVMPRLRTFDNPPFRTIGEAVEYFSQIFVVSRINSHTGRMLSIPDTGPAIHTFTEHSSSVSLTRSYLSPELTRTHPATAIRTTS